MIQIELKSRYKESRYIQQIAKKEFIVYGKSDWIRYGDNFVDFCGGPAFVKGGIIPEATLKIKNINRQMNIGNSYCYKLTVE